MRLLLLILVLTACGGFPAYSDDKKKDEKELKDQTKEIERLRTKVRRLEEDLERAEANNRMIEFEKDQGICE